MARTHRLRRTGRRGAAPSSSLFRSAPLPSFLHRRPAGSCQSVQRIGTRQSSLRAARTKSGRSDCRTTLKSSSDSFSLMFDDAQGSVQARSIAMSPGSTPPPWFRPAWRWTASPRARDMIVVTARGGVPQPRVPTLRQSVASCAKPLCPQAIGSARCRPPRPATARRTPFLCGVSSCPHQIFAEHFDTAVLAERARRMGRQQQIVHHLGLALGGRPGAGFA